MAKLNFGFLLCHFQAIHLLGRAFFVYRFLTSHMRMANTVVFECFILPVRLF